MENFIPGNMDEMYAYYNDFLAKSLRKMKFAGISTEEDMKDTLQEFYLYFYRKNGIETYDPNKNSSFSCYLYSCLQNLASNIYTRNKRNPLTFSFQLVESRQEMEDKELHGKQGIVSMEMVDLNNYYMAKNEDSVFSKEIMAGLSVYLKKISEGRRGFRKGSYVLTTYQVFLWILSGMDTKQMAEHLDVSVSAIAIYKRYIKLIAQFYHENNRWPNMKELNVIYKS